MIASYDWYLEWMGRRSEYGSYLRSRIETADPLMATIQCWIAWRLLWARDYEEAIEYSRRSLALRPDWIDPWVIISFSYELQGREDRAFEAAVEALRNRGEDETGIQKASAVFAETGLAGFRKMTRYHYNEKTSPRPINLAMEFILHGDTDRAFEWLRKSWTDPLWGGENAPSSPFLDPLRDDPRFEQLLRELNLPQKVIQAHLRLPEL